MFPIKSSTTINTSTVPANTMSPNVSTIKMNSSKAASTRIIHPKNVSCTNIPRRKMSTVKTSLSALPSKGKDSSKFQQALTTKTSLRSLHSTRKIANEVPSSTRMPLKSSFCLKIQQTKTLTSKVSLPTKTSTGMLATEVSSKEVIVGKDFAKQNVNPNGFFSSIAFKRLIVRK
ncbi:hypothetical protein ACKWTF_008441 [Chironomus riparius]